MKYELLRQQGLTLVELLVSLTVSAFILAGVVQLYATSSQNSRTFEGAARIQENARYAFTRLERDITQAGSGGCFGLISAESQGRFVNALKNNAAKNQEYDYVHYVLGDTTDNSGINNSDSVLLRYADRSKRIQVTAYDNLGELTLDNTDPDFSDLKQFDVVYVANCVRAAVFMITNAPSSSDGIVNFAIGTAASSGLNSGQENASQDLSLGDHFALKISASQTRTADVSLPYLFAGESRAKYQVESGQAGTCSASAEQNCVLTRNGEELVEGVHDMQVEYGWQLANGNLRYATWADVATAGAESLIDRIKVTLSLNSVDPAPSLDGSKYMEKQISRVFMIRNQLPVY
ncbi:prepilin-type N-terminal cleavage/methylation domain-containing protein [Agaribacterium sp. ZY112]|uniref:prepilin-type N-terminal cleavage/methylation domain-containing protein n=1 Tax=Agaribacterium sp. ZY112 TaxID=3233574 RepID=UPI00352483C7